VKLPFEKTRQAERMACLFSCRESPQQWQNRAMNSPRQPAHKPQGNRSLRDQVDELLPGWQSWYPSLFDAAQDLGILRARVCDLSSLVLSNRHASVYNEAVQAFRNQWSVEEPEDVQEQEQRGRNRRERHKTAHATDEETSEPKHFPDDVL